MFISTKGRYGTQAMLELAKHQGSGPVTLRSIAESQGLSEPYLEQLFSPLRKAGLVRSVRGAQGGYLLADDPDNITVGDILRVLEGPIAPTVCAQRDWDGSEECCQEPDLCAMRGVWQKMREKMEEVVDSVTLGDLSREARKKLEERNPMFYI